MLQNTFSVRNHKLRRHRRGVALVFLPLSVYASGFCERISHRLLEVK
jgi:hypothetical protein